MSAISMLEASGRHSRPAPPTGKSPLAVQRLHAVTLNDTANKTLYGIDYASKIKKTKEKSLKNCQEIQVMYLNGAYFISANTEDDTDNISKLEKNYALLGLDSCTKKAEAGDGSKKYILIGTGTSGSEIHAEQNLLRIIDRMIQNNTIEKINDKVIEIWGVKPPCGGCKRVLSSFADALYKHYKVHLLFEGRTYERLLNVKAVAPEIALQMEARAAHSNQPLDQDKPRNSADPDDVNFQDFNESATDKELYAKFKNDFTTWSKKQSSSETKEEKYEITPQAINSQNTQQIISTQNTVRKRPQFQNRKIDTTQIKTDDTPIPKNKCTCKSIAIGVFASILLVGAYAINAYYSSPTIQQKPGPGRIPNGRWSK